MESENPTLCDVTNTKVTSKVWKERCWLGELTGDKKPRRPTDASFGVFGGAFVVAGVRVGNGPDDKAVCRFRYSRRQLERLAILRKKQIKTCYEE